MDMSRVSLSLTFAVGLALATAVSAAQDRGVSETVSSTPGSGPQKWAVIIGVGAYEDPALAPLPNAVRDAKALRDALVSAPGGIAADNVLLLTDDAPEVTGRPTRSSILAQLGNWARLAGAEDSLLVYFAGHGVEDGDKLYLAPCDARKADIANTCLPYALFESKLNGSAAKRALVILDACHSGTGRGADSMTRSMMSDLEHHAEGEGRITLASCKEDEVSHEYNAEHGAFTWFLLEGLAGKADTNGDSIVSALELSQYSFEKVRRWAAQSGFAQTPRLISNISGDIPLARVALSQEQAPESSPTVAAPAVEAGPRPGEVRTFEGGEFAWIPPGTFEMGSNLSGEQLAAISDGSEGDKEFFQRERPAHRVTLTKGYWLGTKEVTQGDFARFVQATGYKTDAEMSGNGWTLSSKDRKPTETAGAMWRNPGWKTKPTEPVVLVSWNDAQAYCQWLSEKTGETYRLPTEAEWEYACGAGATSQFFWGDKAADGQDYLNGPDETESSNGHEWVPPRLPFKDRYCGVAPVGNFRSNRWGLYDMLGNVCEWCADWYGSYAADAVTDPMGPASGESRVVRGGAYSSKLQCCRSASRTYAGQAARHAIIGFRLLRAS
jgi:formylglycine-generating enzyme required for sulfatase activity